MGDNVGRGQRKRELSTKKKESLLALKEVAASTSSSKQSSRKSKKDKEVVVMKPTSTVSLAYEKGNIYFSSVYICFDLKILA